MGLISGILTLPLAPVRGVTWIAEVVQEQAELELYDEGAIVSQLTDVQIRREAGELTEEEAAALEEDLLERLIAARERNAELQSG